MARAELGNLTARIFYPPWRMSTVKIRTGSLFRTSLVRMGLPGRSCPDRELFPKPSTGHALASQDVHRLPSLPACTKPWGGCKVEMYM